MDLTLPVVDLGAATGRQTRALASSFPLAGDWPLFLAPAAVARAKDESRGVSNVDFRVLDLSEPGAGARLHAELGPVNAHIRGVLHATTPEAIRGAIANIRDFFWATRALSNVVETDFDGDALDHLEYQGASASAIPEPLRLCIGSGVRPPMHFSEKEMDDFFPRSTYAGDLRPDGAPHAPDAQQGHEGDGMSCRRTTRSLRPSSSAASEVRRISWPGRRGSVFSP